MNMLEYIRLCISVGSGMVGSKAVLDCVKQISKVVVLIDTHFFQAGMKVPIAPHPHLHLAWLRFHFSHSGGCIMISHPGFNLHFPDASWSYTCCYLLLCDKSSSNLEALTVDGPFTISPSLQWQDFRRLAGQDGLGVCHADAVLWGLARHFFLFLWFGAYPYVCLLGLPHSTAASEQSDCLHSGRRLEDSIPSDKAEATLSVMI